MNTHADTTPEKKSQQTSASSTQAQSGGESTFQLVDNRPEAVAQRKLQEVVSNSPQAKQAAQLQAMADLSSSQEKQPIQKKENQTGLPDNLKSGVENLSGYSMDDVKVHYNSDKPSQLQAHAYAQGTDIHLASGQEKHLPHEAWHVVQQKQGRVKPTMQMKGEVNINDDAGLEKEADVMGAKAVTFQKKENTSTTTLEDIVQHREIASTVVQREGTGLASDEAIEAYTGAGKAIFDNWSTLSPVNRAVQIGTLANTQLTGLGVPACAIDGSKDLGSNNGEFGFSAWSLDINKNLLDASTISRDEFAALINTMYHEARHCEQWFRSARWRAGMGRSKDQIAQEMGIPTTVANSAFQNKLAPISGIETLSLIFDDSPDPALLKRDKELKEAEVWYNSVYGTGHDHREATLKSLASTQEDFKKIGEKYLAEKGEIDAKKAELEKMKQEYDVWMTLELFSNSDEQAATNKARAEAVLIKMTPLQKEISKLEILILFTFEEGKKAKIKKDEAYVAYRALPEEVDAWSVGGKAEARYKEKFSS